MGEWIEQCALFYGALSWEGLSRLIKIVHRYQEEYPCELIQREIDLACGLKDEMESIFYTLIIFFIVSHYINVFLLYISSYIFIY